MEMFEEILLMVICIVIVLISIIFGKKIQERYIKKRGKQGESMVTKTLLKYGGKTLDNYMILDKYNNSHQIDHIFIDHHGVFVIETKNRGGYIYGTENEKNWTQVLAAGDVVHQFRNPIKQNATHYYQIRDLLARYNNIPIYSCVVFTDGNLDNVFANNVFDIKGLIQFIANKPIELSSSQVETIFSFLENKKANISEKEHVASIKQNLDNINNHICPRCNGNLVIRNGKNGQFYGCSNFPKCKFTKQIDDFDTFDK